MTLRLALLCLTALAVVYLALAYADGQVMRAVRVQAGMYGVEREHGRYMEAGGAA